MVRYSNSFGFGYSILLTIPRKQIQLFSLLCASSSNILQRPSHDKEKIRFQITCKLCTDKRIYIPHFRSWVKLDLAFLLFQTLRYSTIGKGYIKFLFDFRAQERGNKVLEKRTFVWRILGHWARSIGMGSLSVQLSLVNSILRRIPNTVLVASVRY